MYRHHLSLAVLGVIAFVLRYKAHPRAVVGVFGYIAVFYIKSMSFNPAVCALVKTLATGADTFGIYLSVLFPAALEYDEDFRAITACDLFLFAESCADDAVLTGE